MKASKSKTVQFKARRRLLQKKRNQLKNRREEIEGVTYESHMGLSNIIETSIDATESPKHLTQQLVDSFISEATSIVFLDIETSGFEANCDVLQLGFKCGDKIFNKYINPTRSISAKATEADGLINVEEELFSHGEKVSSSPLRLVLARSLQYLQQLNKPCTLLAHNCTFDSTRLTRMIKECSLESDFESVIAGFADTLQLFRKKFPERTSKGACSLTTLASEIVNLSTRKAHNAIYDVILLEQLVFYCFSFEFIIERNVTFLRVLPIPFKKGRTQQNLKSLEASGSTISDSRSGHKLYSNVRTV